jgi:uncharacterized protein YbjT (DUF2867 family)
MLVPSATGKVPQEIIRQLAALDVDYRAGSRHPDKAREALGDDFNVVKLDYADTTTFAHALDGVERMFVMHPLGKVSNALLDAFIDAAKQAGVQHIVMMSALGANEHPDDPICRLEQSVKESGLAYTILRPNWFMQNFYTGPDFKQIQKRNEVMLPSGEKRLSLIDTRDIAAVAVQVLVNGGHEGAEYQLTGSEAVTYGEVATLLSDASGRTITHYSPAAEEIIDRMKVHSAPPDAIAFMEWLYADIKRGLTAQITTTVRDVTGREPITLAQYVHDYADVWRMPVEA